MVDFGQTVGVGYTAEEAAMLLESEAYRDVTVYRIQRAAPDGTMELKGVSKRRFQLETGLFFYSADLPTARRDYSDIRALARRAPLPCRAELFLAQLPEPAQLPFLVGLSYPAEHDEDLSAWMLNHNVTAGRRADGGVGQLHVIRERARVIESTQLHAHPARRARTREQVLASVGQAIQRIA